MRHYIKKQILQIMDSLEEAESALKQLCEEVNIEKRNFLLSEMQNTVIKVGSEIENTEDDVGDLILQLEEYCELLWKCDQASTKNEGIKVCEDINSCRKSILQIIKYQIIDRREIVFLPYKASMWDSFESIWHEAKACGDCDVYVVPIPYFDRISDGKLRQMYYEGGEFPDYVPITHYQKYSLENRHPDIIYFNNPYDEYNMVTSVLPDFYSSRLKNYTEMLVYIPYFVCTDDVSKHFCITMGVFNADRVIVQSQKVRETYIRSCVDYLIENEKKKTKLSNNEEKLLNLKLRNQMEKKILAVGSPKIDKVINSKLSDFCLPDEWKKKLVNNDGTKKKLILYNTSLQGLIVHKEKAFKKIKKVIEYFSKNKDYVLWWRPHPLFLDTVESMIPNISSEVGSFINNYQLMNYGIYDNTADLHRAICFSDAYYGDEGSLVALYRETKKPLMLQNYQIPLSNINIWFEAIAIEENKGWFSAGNLNGLFEMDMKTYQCRWLGAFPEERLSEKRLYGNIVKYKDFLVFSPMSANKIAIYSLAEKKFIMIPIKDIKINNKITYKKEVKFFSMARHDNIIVLFGAYYPGIIRIDMNDLSIKYITNYIYELDRYFVEDLGGYFRQDNCIVNDKVIIPSSSCNALVEYDFIKDKVKVIGLQSKVTYSGITYDGLNFWLCPKKDGQILLLDAEWNELYISYPHQFINSENAFISIVSHNSKVYAITAQSNMLLEIDIYNHKCNCIEDYQETASNYFRFYCSYIYKDNMFLFSSTKNGIIPIDDLSNVSIINLEPKCASVINESVFEEKIQDEKILWESNELPLEGFLSVLDKFPNIDNKNYYVGDSGKKIYHKIKGEAKW